jgi:hypothetical protein
MLEADNQHEKDILLNATLQFPLCALRINHYIAFLDLLGLHRAFDGLRAHHLRLISALHQSEA